eukprot:6476499-Amphidinium_carterae.1
MHVLGQAAETVTHGVIGFVRDPIVQPLALMFAKDTKTADAKQGNGTNPEARLREPSLENDCHTG